MVAHVGGALDDDVVEAEADGAARGEGVVQAEEEAREVLAVERRAVVDADVVPLAVDGDAAGGAADLELGVVAPVEGGGAGEGGGDGVVVDDADVVLDDDAAAALPAAGARALGAGEELAEVEVAAVVARVVVDAGVAARDALVGALAAVVERVGDVVALVRAEDPGGQRAAAEAVVARGDVDLFAGVGAGLEAGVEEGVAGLDEAHGLGIDDKDGGEALVRAVGVGPAALRGQLVGDDAVLAGGEVDVEEGGAVGAVGGVDGDDDAVYGFGVPREGVRGDADGAAVRGLGEGDSLDPDELLDGTVVALGLARVDVDHVARPVVGLAELAELGAVELEVEDVVAADGGDDDASLRDGGGAGVLNDDEAVMLARVVRGEGAQREGSEEEGGDGDEGRRAAGIAGVGCGSV